jgi:hypothetical protein
MFVNDRNNARQFFFLVWNKYHQQDTQLEPLEQLVLGVILEHPEYHKFLENQEDGLIQDFTPEMGTSNPFLHMGMHIALKEQVSTDRPAGIAAIYQDLIGKSESSHELEHKMMECLGEALWTAQRNQALPDDQAYLSSLRKLIT